MSVRAYRFDEVTSDVESFNLWHDHRLMDFLDDNMSFFAPLDENGNGLVNVPLGVLQDAIRMSAQLDLDKETVAQLRKDVSVAKASNNESVTYNCF